jgi:hypothetical protein
MKRSLFAFVLGLFLVAGSGVASAQDAVVEGPGYPIGEGTVLHPAVSLETGFISNVFYEDVDPVAAAVVRLIGTFSIASQGHKPEGEMEAGIETEGDEETEPPVPSKLDFRLGGQLILMGYLSGNDRVRDQSDIAGSLDGHLIAFPEGDVSFLLDDTFVRDARPKNFETFGNLNRDWNHFQAAVKYQPGGRALSFAARYENVIDRFEGDGSSFANRLQHTIGLRSEWQWLPITKLYADASLGFFGSLGDSMGFKPSSMPLRIQIGIGTALSEVTTLRAHLGYANGFYSAGDNFNMAIGGVEFGYRYTQYGRVRLVADYDFRDSLQANFYRDLSFLAKVDHQFGLLVTGADAGLRLRAYRGISPAIGAPSRDDLILTGAVRANYLYRDWLAMVGRLEATMDETDYTYSAPPMTDSPKFTRFEAYLGVSAAF